MRKLLPALLILPIIAHGQVKISDLPIVNSIGPTDKFITLPSGGATSAVAYSVLVSGVDVAGKATAGIGTSISPWTGWDTAITWSDFTRYRFRSGYYAYATSPNFAHSGIELIGEPGTYIVHTGTGDGFTMDAGSTVGSDWLENMRVENIIVMGSPTALTGTMGVTSGQTTVTGSGTAFVSQVTVGDSITFSYGQSTAKSYIVSVVTDNTHLTINRNASATQTADPAKVTKTQNGFYLRGIRNSVIDRCSAKDVAVAAIRTEACVTNSLRMFRCTFHEPTQGGTFQCRPQYGIVTSGRSTDWSTTCNIEEPVIEGMQIYGIWFKSDSYGNTVINGTSESNPGIGIQLDGPSNTLIGIDVEQNTGIDLVVNSERNSLLGIFCDDQVTVTSTGHNNILSGGYYQNLTIDASAFNNRFLGAKINGTFIDNGNDTTFIKKTSTNRTSSIGIPTALLTTPSSGTIATDAILTNLVTVNMTGTCAISAPTNAFNGADITWRLDNSSGAPQNITWDGVFQAMTGAALPASLTDAGTTYVRCRYSTLRTKWQVVQVTTP